MKKNNKHFVTFSFFLIITTFCFAQSSINSEANTDSRTLSFQYVKKLNSVFDFVLQNYVDVLDPKTLYEGALKGMLNSIGDPYTLYLDESEMRELSDTTSGNFGGVGLSISKSTESTQQNPAYVEVASPMEGTPGAKAGIQSGDKITAINGKPTPPMTMNEVLESLRGEPGTPVTITILRGKNMQFDVTLIRDIIEVPTVKYGMIENSSIGYIRLIQFTPETANRLQIALDSLNKSKYTGLIIDLRDNPGGLITSAVDVANKFIDEGPIVTTKSRLFFENHQYLASKDKTTIKKGIPIIVLINRGAASASEIVSGALKDYHIAYLVGECTYGKGSVQQVIPLSNTDGIKMTMARYYTPSDVNIDKIGIPPDLEIKNLQTFTEDEEKIYIKMAESEIINTTIENNPDMTEEQIFYQAEQIAKQYPLDLRFIRRVLRIQSQKNQEAPLYDLDWDLQLNKAIQIINSNNFDELMKSTKTLKELQDEKTNTEQTEQAEKTAENN